MGELPIAFAVAVVVALLGIPPIRRLALSADFVDHPAERKVHAQPVPYLGGIPIIMAVAVGGVMVHGEVNSRFSVAIGAATFVGILGLLDDHLNIAHGWRLVAEIVAAGVVVAAGVRLHVTGVEALDVALTMAWIVGITNAVNFMDNMDGLAAGVAALAATGTLVMAALGEQQTVARLAIAVVGACIGFLYFNRRPASIFMGDAGSLFLGFVLAVAVLEVDPARQPPASFATPLLLLALPVLDTTFVTVARLRHGRSPQSGGRDHISHRLVARGLSPGTAVGILLLVEAALATLAVVAGRGVVALPEALGAAALLLLLLTLAVVWVPVYEEPLIGFPSRLKLAIGGVLLLLFVLAVPAALAMLGALDSARTGRSTAAQAISAANVGDHQRAAELFAKAEGEFASADDRLHGPGTSLGLAVPVLSSNLRAARVLTGVGLQLSSSAKDLSGTLDPSRLVIQGGSIPMDEIERVTPVLERTATALTRARRQMASVNYPYLLPPVKSATEDLRGRLAKAQSATVNAAEAARLAPDLLGTKEPRRYFLAIENTAEIRGGGGFIGNYGELLAENGTLRLTRFGRLDELREGGTPFLERQLDAPADFLKRYDGRLPEVKAFAHVNFSPDFPTTARLITSLYPQAGGAPIDGVISVDPDGLAALLRLTGPVRVSSWPVPLTADNIVRIATREQYERFEGTTRGQRPEFLGDAARAVWERVLSGQLGNPTRVVNQLSPATKQRHLRVYLNRPEEAALVRQLGIAGAIPRLRGDSLLVTNHNGGGNKLDAFLEREVHYRVRVEPEGDGMAKIAGVVEVRLRNTGPASGLPPQIIGGPGQPIAEGDNLTIASVYTPLTGGAMFVQDKRTEFRSDRELGRLVHWTYLQIPSDTSLRVLVPVAGRLPLAANEWYSLDVLHQPTLRPDKVTVDVELPAGWEIADTVNLDKRSSRVATTQFDGVEDRVLSLRIRRIGVTGLWKALTG